MSAAAPAILDPERAWKAERRRIVTASEVAAILGEDPRRGAFAVWSNKVAGLEVEETLPMRRGRRLEALIVEEYGEQTGRPTVAWLKWEVRRHPSIEWLGATLDATTQFDGSWLPLEAKAALGSAGDWKGEPPTAYQIQAQVQAQCFDSPLAAIAGLVGPGPLATFDLPRDDKFFAVILPELERFLWHVRNNVPPEADGKPGTSAALRALWSNDNGETVPLDGEALQLVEQWEAAGERVAAAAELAEELENKLRRRLGPATFGALPDGTFLACPVTKVKGYVREVKPTSYRRLRRFRPRIRRRG